MQKNTDIDTGLAPLWLSQQTDPLVVDSLAAELGVGSLLATVLASRGLADPGQARAFLDSSLATEDFDAAGIEGLSAVAQALAQAIGFKKRILVFGDYDVDGVSATALLYLALRELSAEALALIPSRMDDGYGLTDQAVVKILAQKPDVLVTVDCGISDREQVFKLVEKGIEVLVTDHHEAGGNVPENVLVADPKLSPGSFGQNLAGAGVALALVRLLGEALGSSGLWEEYIDLACLGTIADQMPLTGFNRALVRAGLDQVNNRPRPGILAMLELQAQAGTSPQTNYTASDLAFGLIPRLNAPGRLGRADQAFEALTTDDPGRARELAEALMQLNEERRRIEAQLSAEALSQAATVFKADSKLVVVSSEGFHEGIRGIVASRLASHFGVPAIVFTVVDGEARGSGRSVGDVNLFAALEAVSHLTLRHGGHESAIGVTVALDDLQRFSTELEKQLALVPPTHFHPPLRVDAQISLGQLDWQGILDLALLEPFGQANPEPLFVSAASQVTKPRTVGNSNTHLSFSALEKGTERAAIWFNCPRIEEFLSPSGLYELVFEPRAELWRNRQNIQLRVREAYHLDGDAALEAAFPELHKGLYDSQNEGLELLAQGRSPLVLMPTGRGKSLIFQLHAARLALKENTASIFVYPLRALINDQQRSLLERFASIGIESQVLCGLNTAEERAETYARLAAGKISVLLTTPEFLMLHAARIAQCTEVGFIAFDEAHHIASSRQFRPAYQDLGEVRRHFPAAQVMAATATADDSWALRIERELRLDSRVVDKARRLNLKLIDLRGTDDRLGHIVGTIQTREPAIVYTYSRDTARLLVRDLRKALPEQAMTINYYHAGLNRELRQELEEGFYQGDVTCLVSTSAFGEGVNIANIRNLLIYHPPFSKAAFNQLAGRAGRDGEDAFIHLLFDSGDIAKSRDLLAGSIPSYERLADLYRYLMGLSRRGIEISLTDEMFAEAMRGLLPNSEEQALSPAQVNLALAVFAELELIEVKQSGKRRIINMHANQQKVELMSSSRYLEAFDELAAFDDFSVWLESAGALELEHFIQGPMQPQA